MSKHRTLYAQVSHALCESDCRGTSKRADRLNHVNTRERVYSNGRMDGLRDMAKNFCGWLRERHPEIRLAKEITGDHAREFLEDKRGRVSDATLEEYRGRLGKLGDLCSSVFKSRISWRCEPIQNERAHKVRDRAMDRADYEAIRDKLLEGRSEARYALEITGRCGARIEEAAGLKVEGIRTDTWVLELREGCKNGRERDVPIREQDRVYFTALKEECERKGRTYVCNGVKSRSLDTAIRRVMRELGLSDKYPKTTDHAARKMWARERMAEERPRCHSEVEAWERVQVELGHGDKSRQNLYAVYVGGKLGG